MNVSIGVPHSSSALPYLRLCVQIYRANKDSPIRLHGKLTRLIMQRLNGAPISRTCNLASLVLSNHKKIRQKRFNIFAIIIIL